MTHRRASAYWFLLPALVLYVLLVLVPSAGAAVISTWRWPGYGPWQFTGMANYLELFRDRVFYLALFHNVLLAAASVLLQLPLALALALALQGRNRLSHLLRALVFSPMILPSAVVAIMFLLLYEPLTGPLAVILQWVGVTRFGFLGDSRAVMLLLIGAISWRHIGFHMMLLVAALQGIDRSLYEAADVDGASSWQTFRHITLPALVPTLLLTALLAVLGSLKYFDLVYIMTGGQPNHASELVSTYMFTQGMHAGRYGYGCALAVALLLVSLCCGSIVQIAQNRIRER